MIALQEASICIIPEGSQQDLPLLSEFGEQSNTAPDLAVPTSPLHVTGFGWRHTPGLPMEYVYGICVCH